MNYLNGRFQNQVGTKISTTDQNMFKATIDFIRGNPDRTPNHPIPVVDLAVSEKPANGDLRVTWLGHSTCLIEIDDRTLLTDPIFSDRASPLSFIGPKRFATDRVFEVNRLPRIDAVLISHDHYDHLDYKTVLELKDLVDRFYVPLGVGDHLRRWGIEDHLIVELDWWEEQTHGPLTVAATPTQHFSGRGLTDRNKTLWVSWVILGTKQSVFFGGDSGYFEGFKKIGKAYGPFDITMLESGAYNEAWADIHMMPEETVQAHIDLKGKVLLPIHWAKFNLSVHPWTEPIKRLLSAAYADNIKVIAPIQGQSVLHSEKQKLIPWWDESPHDRGRRRDNLAGHPRIAGN